MIPEASSDTPQRQSPTPAVSTRSFAEPISTNSKDRFSPSRKMLITAIVSFGGFNSNLSSQIVSPGIPEVAATFETTGTIINLTNALLEVGIISSVLFLACSIGTALSPNLATFFVFRILSAVMGTAFQIIGPECVSDIYSPSSRGTALSWFLCGTLIAPSLGPFLGGVIVAYKGWRMLFWLQTALVGLSCVLTVFLLPETSMHRRITERAGLGFESKLSLIGQRANPILILAFFRYPNIIFLGIGTSALMWNMQALLTPVRYVVNPRFNLMSPLHSGLFYLAPGLGFMTGLLLAGRWADRDARHWAEKRGRRIPEDRLRGSLVAMGVFLPGSMLIYGWAIEKEVGGIPLPVICMFVQGVSQMICLPRLNTYCIEVRDGKGSEVMAGNLFIRFIVAAIGTAVCIPAIETIGVGWMSTITVLFIILSTAGIYWVASFHRSEEATRDPEMTAHNQAVTLATP
ncbi:hypothetical protein ACLX1H_007960 [Fusarium chlamydosporum]